MREQLSHEKRLRVVRLFLNKWQVKDIARQIGCSCSTVYHIKENLLNHGSVYKPQLKAVGRPTKVPESGKDAIKAFMQEHPEAQQKDVRLFLSTVGVDVHQATISRVMKELRTGEKNYKLKKDEPRAGPSPAVQPHPDQFRAIQLPTDRPLCGRPDCKGFKPLAGQTSFDPSSSGQVASEPAPSLQSSSGQHLPSQSPVEQHQHPQHTPLQPSYYAHHDSGVEEPLQQQPEHALEVLAEATEHHSEAASGVA
ncbi:MAG: hypothetical protein L6R39_002116 [Caloplaca ligustica]|nr:MAG: hypothetical protein L6R39_002116 [Caloplaca ligustica]